MQCSIELPGRRPAGGPTGCPAAPAGACADNAATALVCDPDGAPLRVAACDAHLVGVAASPAWCTP